MQVHYIFPEPLPLPRARGIQVTHTLTQLAQLGVEVRLYHAPGDGPVFPQGKLPKGLTLIPISREFAFLGHRIRSNQLFFRRLRPHLHQLPRNAIIMVRHIKLAALIAHHFPDLSLIYEAHEVFAATVAPRKQASMRRMEAAVLQRARTVITNSEATATWLKTTYPDYPGTPVVIPNGVNLPPHLPEKPWNELQAHIIYAGSFFGWKGVADLMGAAAHLPGCTLRLIGGDTAQHELLRQESPPSQARVEMLPRLPHAQIMAELAAACIAVLPNRPDVDSQFTSPIKLFEYMGAGCAIVASDLPSIREILSADEAEWFTPGEASSLAAAVQRLCAHPERARRMAAAVRAKAGHYTWGKRGERLLQALSKIS
ncbi:glycosyltransferase family 4 protein [Azovibrio restrictus]|uniref:glycosyltransferase family 4 protein n=1 Tax=Azovibrio restrictus TaxID=146938 RepID=UPI0026EDCED8|nr:glycosyltransferase family 4 protein [Azovibrio restrictus]MDD3483738.1 glycosyltransferase family 4 protein [Azovibrio restrictus]